MESLLSKYESNFWQQSSQSSQDSYNKKKYFFALKI